MKLLSTLLLLPILAWAQRPAPVFEMSIERLDPALDALLAPDAKVEKLAEGFTWSEGPAWYQGSLVFSDVKENTIFRWKEGQAKAEVFIQPSGMTVPTEGFQEKGSNGLAHDAQGRLIVCQHGDRRIARWENGKFTTLADRFDGKRFSSPNDLVITKKGDIYFTDPPYGLEKLNESPIKELRFNGVYRLRGDKVSLVTNELTFPNGIALSPDEATLYIAVSDSTAPRIMAYAREDRRAGVSDGRVVFDARSIAAKDRPGSCDGLKVDQAGNLWATGPGGVLILSPAGKHLGTILTHQPTGNCCWGDDGSTLYITSNMFLARVKTKTKGAGW